MRLMSTTDYCHCLSPEKYKIICTKCEKLLRPLPPVAEEKRNRLTNITEEELAKLPPGVITRLEPSKEAPSEEDVEALSAKLHDIYQKEAHRQEDSGLGPARHYDEYEKLSEPVKEFDRVLARYILSLLETTKKEAKREAIEYINKNLMWGRNSRDELVMDSVHLSEILEAAQKPPNGSP